jgi:hypothetical protein
VGGLHEAVADLYESAAKAEWAVVERRKSTARTPRMLRERDPVNASS